MRPAVPDGAYTLTDVVSGETTAVTMIRQTDGNYTIDNGIAPVENVTLRANRDGSYTLNEIVYVIEPQKAVQTVIGDVNADGTFSVADIVLLQKWLLAVPETHLADWKAGDLYEDERLDIIDLAMMKGCWSTVDGCAEKCCVRAFTQTHRKSKAQPIVTAPCYS